MGERAIIRTIRNQSPTHPWVSVGPGHDCAVLQWDATCSMAFKMDQVVEGTHFLLVLDSDRPELTVATPFQIGWKALAKTCSDIAACGFWPVAATVALQLRQGLSDAFVYELHQGVVACCHKFKLALAGGDIASGRGLLSLSVSMLGRSPFLSESPCSKPWLRSGAQPGDYLLVTGALGGSLRSGRHLSFMPRLEEARRIRALAGAMVHACIDITDGLARDAGHLCTESNCGLRLESHKLPLHLDLACYSDPEERLLHALSDGEDFELLLAVAPQGAERLLKKWDLPTPLSWIGTIEPESSGRIIVDASSKEQPLPDLGYEHGS